VVGSVLHFILLCVRGFTGLNHGLIGFALWWGCQAIPGNTPGVLGTAVNKDVPCHPNKS